MAGYREGPRVRRDVHLHKGFVAVAMILLAIGSSHAQQGFLSIDCGNTISYNDTRGLEWVSDGRYIMTGSSAVQTVNSSIVGVVGELEHFRYFPETRSKFCYELPTSNDTTYLIRTRFYLNKTQLTERRPFQFTLSMNSTDWFTIISHNDSKSDLLITQEAIVDSAGTVLYICLQPVLGVPFISTLELRALDSAMYSFYDLDGQYLALYFRYNLGASSTTPDVRYPNDTYDRIWENPGVSWANSLSIISLPAAPDNTSNEQNNYVPTDVMKDAWMLNYSAYFSIYPYGAQVSKTQAQDAYVALYSENLSPDPIPYNVPVFFDNSSLGDVRVWNESQMESTWSYTLYGYTIGVTNDYVNTLSVTPNNSLTTPNKTLSTHSMNISQLPLNAFEAYARLDFNYSSTYDEDAAGIDYLKQSFALTDWQGDPCTPVPYNWISCAVLPSDIPSCISDAVQFSDSSCQDPGGPLQYVVSSLDLSQLPWNTCSQLIRYETYPMQMQYLTTMTFTNSCIDTRDFDYLVQVMANPQNLQTLDFSYNIIDSLPTTSQWSDFIALETFNFAHNQLTGMLTLPEATGVLNSTASFTTTLQYLNLSSNNLSSISPTWPNLTALTVIDLSFNQLGGDISSLEPLLQSSLDSLQELHVSDNMLNGTFPSDFYFSELNLTVGIFDQNLIGGTLDLNALYYKLKDLQEAGYDYPTSVPLFSFANNNIDNIIPTADDFLSLLPLLIKSQGGILLGNNPYCSHPKSYLQGYLCRLHILDEINYEKADFEKIILSTTIPGGVIFILLCCIISVTLWKLWKQVYALRQIQEALAEQKVRPVFYQYNDIKAATGNFHMDNKLGEGGFGDVYKGTLEDATMIAVKRLFSSKEKKDLGDFLNEVVLITCIKHRNLVQLKGCCIKDKQRMLVYEYVEEGNLAEALYGRKLHGDLTWDQRFKICVGVARGLSYLHEELKPSIIHRDIKPENILLDKDLKPKIADFNLARHFQDDSKSATITATLAGSRGYLSPEYCQGFISQKLDVYSYGIVVLEIISGRKCIDHQQPADSRFLKNWVSRMHKEGCLSNVLQLELRNIAAVSDVIRTLKIGLLCVQQDPKSRPSMSEVVGMLLGNMHVVDVQDVSTSEDFDFPDITLSDREFRRPINDLEQVNEERPMEVPLLDLSQDSTFSISLDAELSGSSRASSKLGSLFSGGSKGSSGSATETSPLVRQWSGMIRK